MIEKMPLMIRQPDKSKPMYTVRYADSESRDAVDAADRDAKKHVFERKFYECTRPKDANTGAKFEREGDKFLSWLPCETVKRKSDMYRHLDALLSGLIGLKAKQIHDLSGRHVIWKHERSEKPDPGELEFSFMTPKETLFVKALQQWLAKLPRRVSFDAILATEEYNAKAEESRHQQRLEREAHQAKEEQQRYQERVRKLGKQS